MPSKSPAVRRRLVILRSSLLGRRFPLGWLCATITAVARSRKGSEKTSNQPWWLTQLDYSLEGSAEGYIIRLLGAGDFYVRDEVRNLNHVGLLGISPFCN